MAEKLKPLNMSFDEALTRLARVSKSKKVVETKAVKEKKAGVAKPRPIDKKSA